ncbi:cell division protein FtsW [Candidatus Gottesmanbacteria bacterium RIFCSPLOWO2_01_FULL_39_12b]|uniref:Probable peptidoglycan glycosyltransferase FtsW n=1 Tax=Candidatus Gottesmanbacteria bacterium RIFCSPLOWO2_01_FULL_39_12b TaxID=1798388 RepID=A0A1F6AR65_9BACT|nr:MAG: cell division protein FtsW [Candidatus Gottesmanbacteria bacterium RIFCSPLOWO2_01_FULL_39_12b]
MIKDRPLKLLKQQKKVDFWIILLTLIFSLFGILMIYEASNVIAFKDFGDKYHFVKDQMVWFGIGLVALMITSRISYKRLNFISVIILIFSIISLIGVFIPGVGIKIYGARRWIGLGGFSFQPSELAKLSLIVYLSSWLSSSSKEKGRFIAFLLLFCLIVGLIILQPDLGTAIIIINIFISMYFLSGASIWHFIFILPIVLMTVTALAIFSPYRFARITTFLNPNIDPLGASYHIRQILISLGSGGIWGLGLGSSIQKYQFLPEATTDSIFAIIGEEFGFIGAILIIILLIVFIYRLILVAKYAPDKQSYLLSCGIFTLFASQTVINLGSMVTLFPLTGVPLSFLSYGGSNLIISYIAIGIILNISRQSIKKS